MKNLSLAPSAVRLLALAATSLACAFPSSASAADGTWTNGNGTFDWQDSSNWSASPFPGATSGFASTQNATFSSAGAGTINLGGTLNIANILVGTSAGAGSFAIGDADDILNITSGGGISINGRVFANQTIGSSTTAINLSTTANSTASFANNGMGNLLVGGNVVSNQAATGVSTLTLGGTGSGTVAGNLSGTGAAGNAGLRVVKNGSGTWTLSGANSYTGSTTVNGGKLVLDYSANTPISSSSVLSLGGGEAVFKGNSSGATTAQISSLILGNTSRSAAALTLDANGGSGVGLTIGTLDTVSSRNSLIDYSSSSGNSITVNAIGSGMTIASYSNYFLMTGTIGNWRSNIIARDSTGYGFAVLSGNGSGTLSRLTTGVTLTASNSNMDTSYFLNAPGTLTRTAALDFFTLTINATNGPITLDMGSNNLLTSSTRSGRSILVTGDKDVAVTGTGSINNAVFILNNYSTGNVSFSLATGTFGTTFAGTGFTNFSGNVTATNGGGGSGIYITGGITRFSKDQTIANNTPFLVEGGVFEIGADLNGATAGDFSHAISTATTNITSGISFLTDSGISAAGADRVVNFGGSAATLTWGTTNFLTNVDGSTDGGYKLLLSSAKSDAKITIENGIALGTNASRTVEVANGSAATDAALSGVISGNGSTFVKSGSGALELSAVNTFSGGTVVKAGTLILSGSLTNTSDVTVAAGATFRVNGTVNSAAQTTVSGTVTGNGSLGAIVLKEGATISPGNSPGILSATSLNLAGGSTYLLEMNSDGTGSAGTNWDSISAGALDISNLTSGNPFVLSLVTLDGSNNPGLLASWNADADHIWSSVISFTSLTGTFDQALFSVSTAGFLSPINGSFSLVQNGNAFDLHYSAVPEPSAAVVAVFGIGMMLVLHRARRNARVR